MNARRRQQAGSDVQLCIAGEARADRSSVAADPGDGGRHSERDVAAICEAVFGCGASVDCSGAVVAGAAPADFLFGERSEEHTSELQSQSNLVCRLLLEKKKKECTDVIFCLYHDKLH